MRAIVVAVMVVIVSISPTNAAQASIQDRMRMSVSVSSYIHSHDYGKFNPFKSNAVEIGAAVIEWPSALANWRSADGKRHGQMPFFYACDYWNIGKVSSGPPFRAHDLIGKSLGDVPGKTAVRLVAELKQLENENIAYLKPAKVELGC